MKGPQLRLRLTVGRLWECPQCRRRETTPGTAVSIACHACSPADALSAVWMKLIDEFPKKRGPSLMVGGIALNTPVVAEVPGDATSP